MYSRILAALAVLLLTTGALATGVFAQDGGFTA